MTAVKASQGWWDGKRFWQCTEHVHSGERSDIRGHRCGRRATKDQDDDGNPTKCALHSLEGKAKKAAERQAKHEAWKMSWEREWAAKALAKEALEIVRQVAEGHNDPRALCSDWVERWERNKAGTGT